MPRKYAGPLQPGKRSAYVPGQRRNRYPARRKVKTVKGVKALAKKVALQISEPKQASQIFSSLTNPGHQTLKHNVTYYQGNLLKTLQGDTANPGTNEQSNRIGNEIYAKGLKIRMQLINDVLRCNVNYKVFVFRYQSGKTLADPAFWCGPSGGGGNMNRMLDFVDTREITILKTLIIPTASKTANMNQNGWNGTVNEHQPVMHSTYRDIWIPLNRKIKYDDNNSPVPKFTDIGIAVIAYDVNNTPQTTTLGYVDFVSRLYFRDP
jgi:hypothetical protein